MSKIDIAFQYHRSNPMDTHALPSLLAWLAPQLPDPPASWQGWQLSRIHGGQNNLLYRAQIQDINVAIKFTRPDARDRAGREFAALTTLQRHAPWLAPIPVLLDRERYSYPVVVQSWLDGPCHATMPASETEWRQLVTFFQALHDIRPDKVTDSLPTAVLTMTTAQDGIERILNGWRRLAIQHYPDAINRLVAQVQSITWPQWTAPDLCLCHTDPNILNFIRLPQRWASVDWENSGWGDPAFELGDLMAHPAYTSLSQACWEDVMAYYAAGSDDPSFMWRMCCYQCLMSIDWAVFFARKAYEHQQQPQPKARLVSRPASWYATLGEQAQHYTQRSMQLLESLTW